MCVVAEGKCLGDGGGERAGRALLAGWSGLVAFTSRAVGGSYGRYLRGGARLLNEHRHVLGGKDWRQNRDITDGGTPCDYCR